jgi:beta-RFAP synthase
MGVRVISGARLHFGLLDVTSPFGGIGVMINRPVTEVTIEPWARFECDPAWQRRIHPIARRAATAMGHDALPELRVRVTRRATPHNGLGSGTQLSMAVAEAICRASGYRCDAERLARLIAGRGQRSAVGVHGYYRGGLIYEYSDGHSDLNPMRRNVALPAAWRVALFRPRRPVAAVSGSRERKQFAELAPVDQRRRVHLKRLAEGSILPAAESADFAEFADGVTDYNRASGELFRAVQGGPYNGPEVTQLVTDLIQRGARGVGQSSWGPTVFAWFECEPDLRALVDRLPEDYPSPVIAEPLNRGRRFADPSELPSQPRRGPNR